MEANLRVHVQFGYDYFYIDYNKKKIFGNSSWDGTLTKDLGSFSDEYDLKEKIGKAVGKSKSFYFENPKKWDC